MDQLLAELRRHHRDLADRVVGSVVVDAKHLMEDQLLAAARDFYAKAATEPTGGRAWAGRQSTGARNVHRADNPAARLSRRNRPARLPRRRRRCNMIAFWHE